MSFRTRLCVATFTCALATCGFSFDVSAQVQQPATLPNVSAASADPAVRTLIAAAEQQYKRGETAFREGKFEEAQKSFKAAVDTIVSASPELRAQREIQAYSFELRGRIELLQAGVRKAASTENGGEVAVGSYRDELANIDVSSLSTQQVRQLDLSRFDFKFTVTPEVYQFINFYTNGRGRRTMEHGLARSGRYRQMAEKIFAEEGVPRDLIWLAQVESVWQTNALSFAAAKGIWQFIPGTGSRFGLRQDGFVDERCAPEASTRAAAKYLKFLHDYFAGDWLLAMAAYNCGEGNVEKAIARCGYADFWELHQRGLLPNETKNYVPAILAVIAVAKEQKKYGFSVTPEAPLQYDVFRVPSQTALAVAADILKVSPETLRSLNPELKRGVTPDNFALRIPAGTRGQFEIAYNALSPKDRLSLPKPDGVEGEMADTKSNPRNTYRTVVVTRKSGKKYRSRY